MAGRHKQERDNNTVLGVLVGAIVVILTVSGVFWASDPAPRGIEKPPLRTVTPPQPAVRTPAPSSSPAATTPPPKPKPFKDCEEAEKADAFPLRKGDPRYSLKLDTDRDGRACENYDRG